MSNNKKRRRKKQQQKTKAGLNTGLSGPLQTTFTMTSKECKWLVPEFLSMLTSEVNTNWTFLCELSSPLPKPTFHRSDLPCRTLMTRRSSPSAEKRSCLKRVSADRLFSSSMFLSCMSESAFSKTSASFWASLYWRRDWTHRHLIQTHSNPTGCCLAQELLSLSLFLVQHPLSYSPVSCGGLLYPGSPVLLSFICVLVCEWYRKTWM